VLGQREPETEFLRFVNRYRTGGLFPTDLPKLTRDGADAFARRVREVRVLIKQGLGETLEPDDLCIQAASLLETELAMTFAARSRSEDADSHFDAAWQISHLIETPKRRLPFQRDWLLAAGLFNHQLIFTNVVEEAFVLAVRFLRNAVRLYPNDPEVLLAAGSVLEWSGSLRGGEPAHLKEAEELYSRARRLAPTDSEILLRHGWVLEKLGREGEAEVPLLQVLELESREDLIYRSRMALGRMAERAGRLAKAIAHYEAAARVIPTWQVAYVALAHALHASGSHDRAREVLESALAMTRKSADETLGGWWSYELGVALRFEPPFERMRAEVMR
ncbi:MAG: tetratricopeptide repeat protein, partial [Vicinamibacteria bacterium]